MRLAEMLDRCLALERRAAAMYRRFAKQTPPDDELHAVWDRLAAEEDDHAASIAQAAAAPSRQNTRVDGWADAVAAAERLLADADSAEPTSRDDRLSLALDLERTEIDVLREVLLAMTGTREASAHAAGRHAVELAQVASRCSTNGRVRLKASLVLAHERLASGSPTR